MRIGILALQGAFVEHAAMLRRLGVQPCQVRLPEDLEGLDGLIIPGGESTTIGKLLVSYQLLEPLRRLARRRALWGTCAGMILMARRCGSEQPLLGVMDIAVERNAFGRQVDSFEVPLQIPLLENGQQKPFPGIFIRAPKLVEAWGRAQIIARLEDQTPVAAWQEKLLVTAFHPELSTDTRFHRLFLKLAGQSAS